MSDETRNPGANPFHKPTIPNYSHLRLFRNQLSPDWQRVHDDMIKRGFNIAANHMAQIVRFSRPQQYWAAANKS